MISLSAQEKNSIPPCPDSPNCVSTLAKKKRQKMTSLPFYGSLKQSIQAIKKIVNEFERVQLIEETDLYLHYTFETKWGNFIDDVEFLADTNHQVIHFRSASRVGYGDFGANKRRMRKITRKWAAQMSTK